MLPQKDKMIELEMLIFRNCEYLLYKADAYSKWTCMSSTTKSLDLETLDNTDFLEMFHKINPN